MFSPKRPNRNSRSQRARRCRCCRRRAGATTLETAIALSLFVTLMLGAVDLGYGVFRQHVLTHATRQLARKAIVRGGLSDRLGSWGPDPISTSADGSNDIAEAASASLVGWELQDVEIHVEWLDLGNDVRFGHRVRVEMSAPHRPIMTFIFGNPTFDLTASSTMAIAH